MPMYEFACGRCEVAYQRYARMAGTPDPACPNCGKPGAREFSVPTVISSELFKNTKLGLDQFDERTGERAMYEQAFKDSGANPTGKVYVAGLARFPGDPEALVDDKDEERKLLRRRGWGCEALGVKAVELPPPPPVPMAADLVREMVGRELAHVPKDKRTPKMLAAAKEKVIDVHGYKPPTAPPGAPAYAVKKKPMRSKRTPKP